MQDELAQLKADKTIAENAKELVAIGYDNETATKVAKASFEGDTVAVIKAQATFVDEQKKLVLADAVKQTPPPPTTNITDTVMTKEKLKSMTQAERFEFAQKNPEEYKKIYGG